MSSLPRSRARQLGNAIAEDTPLARLQQHAQQLARIQRQLDLLLPDYLQGAVAVANLQQGVLALHVKNASVASRLKMIMPRLKEGLWAQGASIEELKVRVRLPRKSETARPTAVREIDEDVLAKLETLRGALPESSPLSGPLARLIARAARRRS
ncbi:DciA family protein [Niveibacterium sp. 24ML]|uniref:DciA family protein n=1 Tax=Niveibacterium sp. 24ML TaxID=2985512 RepID=UPI00226DA394|nr:DciA family protein [Niveibacterium sp. 24ML]MCX9158244.1 DciA family protein [Niveibacterium sp. 24ML]